MDRIYTALIILFLLACSSQEELKKPDVELVLTTSSDYSIIINGKDSGLLDDKYNKIQLQESDSIVIVIKRVQ